MCLSFPLGLLWLLQCQNDRLTPDLPVTVFKSTRFLVTNSCSSVDIECHVQFVQERKVLHTYTHSQGHPPYLQYYIVQYLLSTLPQTWGRLFFLFKDVFNPGYNRHYAEWESKMESRLKGYDTPHPHVQRHINTSTTVSKYHTQHFKIGHHETVNLIACKNEHTYSFTKSTHTIVRLSHLRWIIITV